MNVYISHDIFKVELINFLKVFYPYESILVSKEKQSQYRIIITDHVVKVAFFDEHDICLMSIAEPNLYWTINASKVETKKIKRQVKGLLYDLCQSITAKSVPWGILTGIRPTKLAFKLLDQLGDTNQVIETLIQDYRLSKKKAELLMKVVDNEMPYMENIMNKHSVYIGVPFCPSKCAYCTFASYQADKIPEAYEAFADVLIHELEAGKDWLKNCHSIYMGGGTPTSLMDEDFERLLKHIYSWIGERKIEFTVEAGRPDTINNNKLEAMKKYGVNRISINPQTMCNETLKNIGRSHSVEEVYHSFNQARSFGFDHINMDMILGLPGESLCHVKQTLNDLIQLNPESVTMHTLALKRGSKLSSERQNYLMDSCDEIAAMVEMTGTMLTDHGYQPYYLYRQKNMVGNFENIGYCHQGKESIYNIQIMEEIESIVAFGAGAISKRVVGNKINRLDQPKNVKTYIQNIDQIIGKKRDFFTL